MLSRFSRRQPHSRSVSFSYKNNNPQSSYNDERTVNEMERNMDTGRFNEESSPEDHGPRRQRNLKAVLLEAERNKIAAHKTKQMSPLRVRQASPVRHQPMMVRSGERSHSGGLARPSASPAREAQTFYSFVNKRNGDLGKTLSSKGISTSIKGKYTSPTRGHQKSVSAHVPRKGKS